MHHLVVIKRFLNYVRGDIIDDANKVTEILATEYKKFVTKITPPNAPKG
jgi:hypothetical protein